MVSNSALRGTDKLLTPVPPRPRLLPALGKVPSSSGKAGPARGTTAKPPRKSLTADTKPSPRTRQRSSSPKPRSSNAKSAAVGTRRSTRHARDGNEDEEVSSPTTVRIKLRVRPPLTTLPLVHREQANIRPKLGPTFEEWFARAGEIAVEQGGLLASEDGPRYTDEMAVNDAEIIIRIEDEAEPGGILAQNKCSVFEPEAEEEPARQWAHMDHLVKAATNFRRLMLQEHQRHRAMAKRLAIACEAEWRRRNPQPKTAEEIEREEMEKTRIRLRLVNKAIAGTWENVKAEINRRRLVEWEAEEQRRVKAALNQAVNLSEQKLQARQARLDTDEFSDIMDDEADTGSDEGLEEDRDGSDIETTSNEDSGTDESNMSSSDDDEDKSSVLSDEGLTQAQLREKYANLPELSHDIEETDATPAGDEPATVGDGATEDDTSDESIDMDDDLGSSEEETNTDSDGDESEADGQESEEDEPSGLLGLFFKKSELKKLKNEAEDQPLDGENDGTGDLETPKLDTSAVVTNGHEEGLASPKERTCLHHSAIGRRGLSRQYRLRSSRGFSANFCSGL